MPLGNPDGYNDPLEQELARQLNPASAAPPATLSEFSKLKPQPIDFSGDNADGEARHLRKVFEAKQQMGLGLARAGGGPRQDPEEFYQATIGQNKKYDPALNFELKGAFMDELRNNPEAFRKLEDQQRIEQETQGRGLGPASEIARQGLTEGGRQQFDQLSDQSVLEKLFPDQLKDLNDEIERGQRTLAGQGEQRNAVLKSQAIDLISSRLENNLISPTEAAAALRSLEGESRLQYNTTNTQEGATLASAIGLPNETPEQAQRDGSTIGGDKFNVSNQFVTARAATAQQTARLREEQSDAEAANFEPKAVNVQLGDGRNQEMIEVAPGKFIQPAKAAPDQADTREPGTYGHPAGWEVKGADGKVRVYDRNRWGLGNDGKLYPTEDKFDADGAFLGRQPAFPDGVAAAGEQSQLADAPSRAAIAPRGAQLAPQKFGTTAAAEAADLPKGTIIEVGGKRYRVD